MGGYAFKDESGYAKTKPISQKDVQPTLDHFFNNVLLPLGVDKYSKLGSTGKKSVSGDLDIAIEVRDQDIKKFKDKLYIDLTNKVDSERVKKVGQNLAVMYPIAEKDDEFVQVDLMLTDDAESTTWLMAGAGDQGVKGVYRNLLLSLIAKKRSEELTRQSGQPVKVTIALPGGIQVKKGDTVVQKRENDTFTILDILGINATPSEIVLFEDLVDFMKKDEKLKGYLDDYGQYIERYVRTDPENAQRAMTYITGEEMDVNNPNPGLARFSEILNPVLRNIRNLKEILEKDLIDDKNKEVKLKKVIGRILHEEAESEEVVDEVELQTSPLDAEKSFAGKARVVFNILKSPQLLGDDIEKIIGSAQSMNLMRFGLKTGAGDDYDFNDVVNKLYDTLLPGSDDSVVELGPYESPNPSGTYSAYMMPSLDSLMIIFGTAGTSGGQRKAGYIYEDEIGEQLQSAGMNIRAETDNAYSDVYVAVKNGELGIEVKLPNAQAGEPTMRYDYDTGKFFASNPKPQNQDIANLVNMDPDMPTVRKRMLAIRDAINDHRAETGDTHSIESILGAITRAEYVEAVYDALRDSSVGLKLATYTVSTAALRDYYMHKGAGLVQVKGKGLYHLNPAFEVTLPGSEGTKKTLLFDFPEAKGAVYFRNNRGINYAMRTQFSAKPLTKLKQSGINLDNPTDRDEFARVVNKAEFPNAKSLVKGENE